MSILYTMQFYLWLELDSSLVDIMEFTLSRLVYLTFTTSKLLSCSSGSSICRSSSWLMSCIIFLPCESCCCDCTDLHTALKWFCFCTNNIFAICQALSGRVPCATVFAIVLPLVYFGCIIGLFLCMPFNNVKVFCLFYLIKGWFFVPFVLLPYAPLAEHAHLLHLQYPLVWQSLFEFHQPFHHHLAY